MAQAQPERIEEEIIQAKETAMTNNNNNITSSSSSSGVCDSVPFRFNVQAPEFVPRSHATTTANATQVPVSGYYYPCFHYLGGGTATAGSDWFFVGDQEPVYVISNPNVAMPNSNSSKNVLTDDLRHKIVKQVEYQFSDIGLLANESLSKHVNKDLEGFVPISVIASTKKIKSLVSNNQLIAQALRSSSKLVVSNDGKKVRRKHPFTEKDREDLQDCAFPKVCCELNEFFRPGHLFFGGCKRIEQQLMTFTFESPTLFPTKKEAQQEALAGPTHRRHRHSMNDFKTCPKANKEKPEVFGSFKTGLYLPTSDIDLQ